MPGVFRQQKASSWSVNRAASPEYDVSETAVFTLEGRDRPLYNTENERSFSMRTCLAALMLFLLSAVPCCAEGDAGFWNTMKPDTRMYYIAGWTDGLRNACGRNREGLCRLLDQNMDDVLHMERIVTAIYKQPAYKVLPVGLLISTAAFYLEGVLDGKKAAEYLNRTVTDMAAGSGDGKDGGEKKPKLLTPKKLAGIFEDAAGF